MIRPAVTDGVDKLPREVPKEIDVLDEGHAQIPARDAHGIGAQSRPPRFDLPQESARAGRDRRVLGVYPRSYCQPVIDMSIILSWM
jgi:hypothetical protein